MSKEQLSFYALVVIFIASISGLLFGYHTAIISGALIFLNPIFQLSPFDEGMVVSVILLGGLFGALIAGELSDRLGRKKTLIGTAFLFILGAMVIAYAQVYGVLIAGRILSGVAAGIISVTAPIYLAEISPPHHRGRCVAVYQLMLSLGILLAYAVTVHYEEEQRWRMLFGIGAIPAILQCVALFFIPETPGWSVAHGHLDRAKSAFLSLRKDSDWKKHLGELKESGSRKGEKIWKFFFSPNIRYVLILGIVLSVLQQATGVNAVIYYAPKIFLTAGITSNAGAFAATMGIGVINFLATFFSMWVLDKLGRRRLLLIGVAGMFLSLIIVTAAFLSSSPFVDKLVVVGLMTYVASFALSLGPVTWVVISEIFPLRVRGKGIAIALAANWLANYVISLLFPNFIRTIGGGVIFGLFTAITLGALWFIYRFIPETKGKSLEQIETMVTKGKF